MLVDAVEHVFSAALGVADRDIADGVDELSESRLVEGGSGIVLGQHPLEGGVVTLDT